MAELIDKKSALKALNDASYGNFNYVTARNAIDCVSTTTEAEIRAKAIDEFAERCKELVKQGELYDYVRWSNWNNSVFKWFDRVADQLKEE